MLQRSVFWLAARSNDGRRALIGSMDGATRVKTFRSVELAPLRVLDTVELAALSALRDEASAAAVPKRSLDRPELATELVALARLARGYAISPREGFAVAGDGSTAFVAGDWVHVADAEGRVVRTAPGGTGSSRPMFVPGSTALLFGREEHSPSVGATYDLFLSSGESEPAPRRLAALASQSADTVLTADERSLCVLAAGTGFGTRVHTIGLTPPFSATREPCLDGQERVVAAVVSPRGWRVAVTTQPGEEAQPEASRVRVLSVDGRSVELDTRGRLLPLAAFSDEGILVQNDPETRVVTVHDVLRGADRTLEARLDLGSFPRFRSATELVFVAPEGDVGVIDVVKAP